MKRIACLGLVALLVSGCTVTDRKNKSAVAAVTGGAAGAYIGWNIFGAGYLAADHLLPRETESLHRATYQSLEEGADGKAAVWKSTVTDASAQITPARSFVDPRGRPCREFQIRFRVGDSRETVRRTACRAADGSWRTI